jgi:hypothetical protein
MDKNRLIIEAKKEAKRRWAALAVPLKGTIWNWKWGYNIVRRMAFVSGVKWVLDKNEGNSQNNFHLFDKTEIEQIVIQEKAMDRWEAGMEHHPKSVELMKFLMEIDFEVYGDHFCWKMGGDGDNGETLMFVMDAYFENIDKKELT